MKNLVTCRRRSVFVWIGLIAMATAWIVPTVIAAGPDPSQVSGLAFYVAKTGSDSLPDDQVNYTVIDPSMIAQILAGVEWSVPRDCKDLEADDSTHMYLKYLDGTRKVYNLIFRDSHISLKNNRGTCFYVEPSTRTLIQDNSQ